MLKKFLMAVIFTTALTFCVTSEKVFANDIWVAESEGYDIYIITDTIVHKTGDDWEGLWVVTKKIRDSQLESTTKWNFDIKNQRYTTSNMRGEHTSIIFKGSLAEKILNKSLQYI